MVRPAHLLTLPLVLALAAGTCLAQEKPADQPTDPDAARKREFLEKLEQLRKATAPKADPAAPAQLQPVQVVSPESKPAAGEQPAGTAPKPVVAPSEPGADPKSIDSPVAPDMVRLGPFTDEVDIKLLVKLVQEELKIQIISTDQALRDKKVSLMPNAIEIKRSELLPFLQLLLEQNGQILTRDVGNVWIIRPQMELNSGKPGAESSTTQVISTLGLKPSSLQLAIQAAKGAGGGGQPASGPLAYLDDLGVIVITDTPRRIDAIKALIATIAAEQQNAEIVRFDLKYVAAPVARVRLLELAGQFTRALAPTTGNDPGAAAINQATTQPGQNASPNVSILAQRLIVNPQGNGLLFRGRPDERAFIEKLIPIVDMPNDLVPRYYDIPAAIIIAEQASRQGLGEFKVMRSVREGLTSSTGVVNNPGQPGQQGVTSSAITEIGGPCFIVDPEGRGFMYYGTTEQQERLSLIVQQFRDAVKRDDVVYEFYKLKHASAPDTAEVIRGLIANQAVGGSSSLLPGGRTGAQAQRRTPQPPATPNSTGTTRATTSASANELGEIVASDDIFVQADERNNQLIVKSPRRLQPQFAKLIEKLDLRRAQVYIDCKIVVVTDTAESRIAVETQLLNANGTGGAFRTLFPNSAMPLPPNNITQFPVIVPALGATAAIIKTGSVAATIIAIANTTDARIVASPQLLVDDNEEAEVVSLEQRPTQTQSQSSGAGTTLTGFGGYEDAGPKLKVKPRISTSNSLSIKYEVELSSFQPDAAASADLPPPKQKNNIKSDSVTLPSDSTLVVGGLAFEQKGKTVFKVPFLGDIPIIGQAFRDERTTSNKRTFYVFITPRVMRDQGFDDLRLNTEGPASAVRILDPLPPPQPSTIPISPLPQPIRPPSGDQNGWNGPNLGYPELAPTTLPPSSRTPGTSEPG